MIESSVSIRASRTAVREALAKLATDAASSRTILTRVGMTMLGRIRRAIVTKARGGTDEAGDRWAPLSPKTIAYSRRGGSGGGRTRTERKRAQRPSQALTKRQADRWWQVYRQALARFSRSGAGGQAKGFAARIAWSVLKREGATTLFDKYKGRQVEILRDTGILLNSLSPGYGGSEQILRVEGKAVVIGTNRKGAKAHHEGDPGRKLPQRRLWPEPSRWPDAWWRDVMDQVKQGALDIARTIIQGARGRR